MRGLFFSTSRTQFSRTSPPPLRPGRTRAGPARPDPGPGRVPSRAKKVVQPPRKWWQRPSGSVSERPGPHLDPKYVHHMDMSGFVPHPGVTVGPHPLGHDGRGVLPATTGPGYGTSSHMFTHEPMKTHMGVPGGPPRGSNKSKTRFRGPRTPFGGSRTHVVVIGTHFFFGQNVPAGVGNFFGDVFEVSFGVSVERPRDSAQRAQRFHQQNCPSPCDTAVVWFFSKSRKYVSTTPGTISSSSPSLRCVIFLRLLSTVFFPHEARSGRCSPTSRPCPALLAWSTPEARFWASRRSTTTRRRRPCSCRW